eukprot:6103529-Amphidinium_carterae.3
MELEPQESALDCYRVRGALHSEVSDALRESLTLRRHLVSRVTHTKTSSCHASNVLLCRMHPLSTIAMHT